jgi:hypothetical protein
MLDMIGGSGNKAKLQHQDPYRPRPANLAGASAAGASFSLPQHIHPAAELLAGDVMTVS